MQRALQHSQCASGRVLPPPLPEAPASSPAPQGTAVLRWMVPGHALDAVAAGVTMSVRWLATLTSRPDRDFVHGLVLQQAAMLVPAKGFSLGTLSSKRHHSMHSMSQAGRCQTGSQAELLPMLSLRQGASDQFVKDAQRKSLVCNSIHCSMSIPLLCHCPNVGQQISVAPGHTVSHRQLTGRRKQVGNYCPVYLVMLHCNLEQMVVLPHNDTKCRPHAVRWPARPDNRCTPTVFAGLFRTGGTGR